MGKPSDIYNQKGKYSGILISHLKFKTHYHTTTQNMDGTVGLIS